MSYSAAYFENKTVIILWRERGIKENSSGLIIQMHYLEIHVLQTLLQCMLFISYSEYPLDYPKPLFPILLCPSVHSQIYLPSLSEVQLAY